MVQLLLVFRVNVRWHMSDLLFAMGDEVIGDFIMAMHFLPLVNMMLMLCPEGAEGTSFAMVRLLNLTPFSVSVFHMPCTSSHVASFSPVLASSSHSPSLSPVVPYSTRGLTFMVLIFAFVFR
jgi:hypothetical protein